MYRVVAWLFACLLPLQFVWGAAAAYCQHEAVTQAAARHVGHHEHQHAADAKPGSDKQRLNPQLFGDDDCGACHATASAVVSDDAAAPQAPVASRRLAFAPVAGHASALARAPDRPQWLRLA